MQKESDNWYSSWFDTPFYHILYKDRNYEEASSFMEELTSFLELPKYSEILDLACGKGRHSKYLNKLGYKVTGVDLSPSSIAYAKQYENENLSFIVHDMSKSFNRKFDAIFNLFTSFGYFDKEEDDLNTVKAIKNGLKPNGFGVIDFLNYSYVEQHLIPTESKTIDGITFYIKRYIENGYIFKDIKFSHSGSDYLFTERVKALTLNDFKSYLSLANCTLLHSFGNYQLNPFDELNSERLILIFE